MSNVKTLVAKGQLPWATLGHTSIQEYHLPAVLLFDINVGFLLFTASLDINNNPAL